ncbi:outer membrane beta-barrel protein [Flavobacterium sp.]|uniref:outer membrane beta-barrel protein n=1 Tax=Flavobacterium sp. TaxID=239 RepID=UPI00286EA2A1|nr:outer membrane beta-barrel protein [Flavobacterium sp.]
MSDKKNIEQLFQERFEDFEATPSDHIWSEIASKLEKKKSKKRIVPFWIKATGIAATFVLGYFAIGTFSDSSILNTTGNTSTKVVSSDSENKAKNNSNEILKDNLLKDNSLKNNENNPAPNSFQNHKEIEADNSGLVISEKNSDDGNIVIPNKSLNTNNQLYNKENNSGISATESKKNKDNTIINTKNRSQNQKTEIVLNSKIEQQKNIDLVLNKSPLINKSRLENKQIESLGASTKLNKNTISENKVLVSNDSQIKSNAVDKITSENKQILDVKLSENTVSENAALVNNKDSKSINIDKITSEYKQILNVKTSENTISENKVLVSIDNQSKSNAVDKITSENKQILNAKTSENTVSENTALVNNKDSKSINIDKITSENKQIQNVKTSEKTVSENKVLVSNDNQIKSNAVDKITSEKMQVLNVKSSENTVSENTDLVCNTKQNKLDDKGNPNINIQNQDVNYSEKNGINSNNGSIVNTTTIKSKLELNQKEFSEITPKDSMAIVVQNPLEQLLNEKEKQEKEQPIITEKKSKWKIKPNVAPIFMNASEGSPIDEEFVDNTKNYENNLSLGLGIDYAITSKLSIRTGINKFDLAYNTNDIAYYADLNSSRLSSENPKNSIKTITMRPESRGMVIEDKTADVAALSSLELAFQNKEEGYLNQRMGYIEVPVEVSYKILDKKFGIDIITGVSTLFLNQNKVSVVSSGLTTVLGEANNLNKIHFSTNIGVGFKYNFWKSFEANLEPTFKYQINTYNANSGGFKPYLIGVYTGISFKF